MKKTMFITSVIMVVVMAIALTTSSLAWFSATGSNTVTTNSLKLTAQSSASTGIAISYDSGSTWNDSITLSPSVTSGLMPLVPFTKVAAYDGDADPIADENARVYAALRAALIGGSEAAYVDGTNENYGTAADDTSYNAFMIGNKIDTNRNYTNDVYRTGFTTDTVWLKNSGTGASAKDIKFTVSCNFNFKKNVDVGGGVLEERSFEYTSGNRGAAQYQQDAVLCVAVLARTEEFDTTANIYANAAQTAGTLGTAGAYADPEKWEIIGYFESKGDANISLGIQSADFKPGHAAASSVYDVAAATLALNKTNNEILRAERQYTDRTVAADVKTVKIVAWYDGSTLNNNNSTQMDLEFALTFNRVEQTTSDGVTVD